MTPENHGVDGSFEVVNWIVTVLTAAVGTLIMAIQRKMSGSLDDLDDRVRDVEKDYINEAQTRQLIADVVVPMQRGQDEIRADVKSLLNMMMHHIKED